MIPISEILGPTIQGEGHFIGQKVIFIRTAGCDYQCKWCDTKYAWAGNDPYTEMTPKEVFQAVFNLSGLYNCSHVVITGGNPCIIGDEMEELIEYLQNQHYHVSVETQGSIWQDWLSEVNHVVISPKPPSSGITTNWETLEAFRDNLYPSMYSIKVVIFDDEDYEYARQVNALFEEEMNLVMYLQVGTPVIVGDSSLDAMRAIVLGRLNWLVSKVVADKDMNEVRVLPQLHTLIWGNRRGV